MRIPLTRYQVIVAELRNSLFFRNKPVFVSLRTQVLVGGVRMFTVTIAAMATSTLKRLKWIGNGMILKYIRPSSTMKR